MSRRTGRILRVSAAAGGDRRGAILPLVSVWMIGLMSVMAFALDVGAVQREKRLAQTAADAAALAGAAELYRGNTGLVTTSARAESARNGFTHGQSGVTVDPFNGPASGYYVGNNRFVEVIVTRDKPMLFGFLLGRNSVNVRARAVAGVDAPSSGCLVALDAINEKAFNVASGSTVNAGTCDILVNSRNSQALLIESASTLNAGSVGVTGGINASAGTLTVTSSQQTGLPPVADPLAYLQMPPFGTPACTYTGVKITGTATLSPGNYCGGIEISSGANVTLNPGLYAVRGGGVKIDGRVSGSGVTIINTLAPTGGNFKALEISSSAEVTLSAMTTGSLAGILFYQDRAAGSGFENKISAILLTTFVGTLYFPTQSIWFESGSRTTITGGVVATKVAVSSNSILTLAPDLGASAVFKRFSLVE